MPAGLPNIGRTIRNIRRAREILAVFAEYGFNDFLQEVGLDSLALRGKRLVGLANPTETLDRDPQAVRLRRAIERLGPTFIKMAQILATRPDLIPADWADEFAKLQDSVPAEPAEVIRPHLDELYNGSLDDRFASFEDTAMAAASMAQVHRATLHDGTEVVLKILRPGIRDVIDADAEILSLLASFIEERVENLGYKPTRVVEFFRKQVVRETDMLLEARSTRRLGCAFEDDPSIGVPRIFDEHTTRGVLCLELVKGTPISKIIADDRSDGLAPPDLEAIVRLGSGAVFRQCFESGFFHADPHPGNLFVVRDSDAEHGLKLVFIDCGMCGSVDPKTADALADIVQGAIESDINTVIDAVLALTDASPRLASDREFRADAWELIGRFDVGSMAEIDLAGFLREFFTKIRDHGLECPADIVYLIKAVSTIQGVGEALSPKFDLIGHVHPYVESFVTRRLGAPAIRRRLKSAAAGYIAAAERLPRDLRDVSDLIRRDKLEITLKHRGVDKLTTELESASANISSALLVASMLLAGAILFLAEAARGTGFGLLTAGGGISIIAAIATAITHGIRQRLR